MRLVSPVEGRLQRFGKWLEYDNWINNTAPAALRVGRSAALATIAMGETIDFPVNVHNWSDVAAERHGQPGAAGELHGGRDLEAVRAARRRARDATVTFSVTNTDTTLPAAADGDTITSTTTNSTRGAGHRGDRHVDPAEDDDRAGAGDAGAGRRRQPR